MTQEDRQILLKDICARLPYGVYYKHLTWNDERGEECIAAQIYSINSDGYVKNCYDDETVYIDNVRPYLFPLSSMTEKMMEEFDSLFNGTFQYFNQGVISASYLWDRNEAKFVGEHECSKLIDFFNSHHIDYRNLIEKGLAIDATGLNIY